VWLSEFTPISPGALLDLEAEELSSPSNDLLYHNDSTSSFSKTAGAFVLQNNIVEDTSKLGFEEENR
jgi:hypothetical protein